MAADKEAINLVQAIGFWCYHCDYFCDSVLMIWDIIYFDQK